ncbi:MAG: IS200/IS605 family transposase [Planctomycetales bacterium]|nr:IS200/IS605 family transposase [Planctomycetales bacterium]
MQDFGSLNHTRWECKYHVVFIPKCRRKVLYGQVRQHLGKLFHDLAGQRESKILEGHLCVDHVHMLIRIPPKHSVSHVVGYVKGKSAIRVARDFMGRHRSFKGYHFWARGYFVSTVGADEVVIREYIRNQEEQDRKGDQNRLF